MVTFEPTYAESFLPSMLAKLDLRWEGFRGFQNTLKKRIRWRMEELGIANNLEAYGALLERDADELARFDSMCRITISRLYRDADVFDGLADVTGKRIWSAGCASGEEPYTLALMGATSILATDADAALIERAKRGVFQESSLRELPASLRARMNGMEVPAEIRARVVFEAQDLRKVMPEGPFDLILCRNMAFTYFSIDLQRKILPKLLERLSSQGRLIIGAGEKLPSDAL